MATLRDLAGYGGARQQLLSELGQTAPIRNAPSLGELLSDTWPAKLAEAAWGGLTLPGDVYAGRISPLSDEGIKRAADLAGLAGIPAMPAAFLEKEGLSGSGVLGSNASRSARIYDPKPRPERPFEADYPGGAPPGKLTSDIDGNPLSAKYVVGRTEAGGSDVALPGEALDEIAKAGTGAPIDFTSRGLTRGDVGSVYVDRGTRLPRQVIVSDKLPAASAGRVSAHEIGHVVDQLAGEIPADRLNGQLRRVYNDLNNPQGHGKPFGPEQNGYANVSVPRELWAEAVRAYMADPNYLKSVAPEVAARIRAHVNGNPRLNRVVQFNVGSPGLMMSPDGVVRDESGNEIY